MKRPNQKPILCWMLAALLCAGSGGIACAQTGAYALDGGTATLSSLNETATTTNESGIYVYGSGSLSVGTVTIATSGNASNGTTSDQYGINAGILAGSSSTKGTVTITGSSNSVVTTGSVANGVFATYTGSSVTMLGGAILCSGSNAHGVDATYGGAVTLSNVNVTSFGENSSAVATDYGGGIVSVTGGTILASNTASGGHSAGVYSTGTITVRNATVISEGDNGGVIDGANAIIFTNTVISGVLGGIKIHNTSGASGNATVTISGGSMTGSGGDGIYLSGAEASAVTAVITLSSNAVLTASSGNLLNMDGGSTGTFTAAGETLTGNFSAGTTNTLYLSLQSSTLTGWVNAAKWMAIDAASTWNMTSNSVIASALTNAGVLNLTGALVCTNVILKSGATLGGGGTLSSNLSVSAGAALLLSATTNVTVGGKLTFGGAVTVAPAATNISAGVYKLLTYSNTLTGTPTFTYSAPSGSGQTATFSTATSGVIYVTITVPATKPAAPANLIATAGDALATLRWNAVTNAASYYVRHSLVSGSGYSLAGASLSTNFTDASLTNGQLYYYEVTATNSAGESAASSEVSTRPLASGATNLTLTASSGGLQISWPSDHTGWILQAQTNALTGGLGTQWTAVANANATNLLNVGADRTPGSVFFRLVHP
jgi:hypothetical protein